MNAAQNVGEDRRHDPEYLKRVAAAVAKRAERARKDSSAFFEFVVKEETTRAPLKTLPHQRVVNKFLAHFNRCVLRMPVGFSKTYLLTSHAMFTIGRNRTSRGAVIAAASGQSQKIVGMVRDYIDTSSQLKYVFPDLRKSDRESDHWTQGKIVVDRPFGIRDATLTAVGYGGKLPGARLNWILVDDLLTEDNTATEEQRKKIARWFNSTVLSRRDIKNTKICVCNTPWNPTDLTYQLEAAGWPTLTMDIEGNIYFSNTCETDLVPGAELPYEGPFDCDDIRPSEVDFPADEDGNVPFFADTRKKAYRLTAHDDPKYDPEYLAGGPLKETWVDHYDAVPLWPERFGRQEIEQLKREYRTAMHQYNQLYMCRVRDDDSALVKLEHIETCKANARKAQVFSFVSTWEPQHGKVFTGVDLATGKKAKSDLVSIFTFAIRPDGYRQPLRVDSGRYSGTRIIELVGEHYDMFNSIIRLETNGGQEFMKQWMREANRHIPIKGAHTGGNKWSREHGVASIFIEIENGMWLIPNDPMGGVPEPIQRWIDSMLYYDPAKHTGDELMACWIAREQARASGALRKQAPGQKLNLGALGAR